MGKWKIVFIIFLLIIVIGCMKDDDKTSTALLKSIELISSTTNVAIGATTSLQAKLNYSDASTQNGTTKVTWISSNTSVATVSKGILTGISEGTTTISASKDGIVSSTLNVIVSNATPIDTSTATQITFNRDSITISGSGATVSGTKVTISSAKKYVLSGSLSNGQIIVNTSDTADVMLILNGIDITCDTSSPLYIEKAEKVIINLAEESKNYLKDGLKYIYTVAGDDEPNATLFSKEDLTINGTGYLYVTGNYKDGIKSKDSLKIVSGNIIVNSEDDGITGKDCLTVYNGSITVSAKGDGLKSTNDADTTKGYIELINGKFSITTGADSIQSETYTKIVNGEFNMVSGGGSGALLSADASAKAIKTGTDLTVEDGLFSIDSAEDGFNSNGNITISKGTFVIKSAMDSIQAEKILTVSAGSFDLTTAGGSSSKLLTDISAKGIKGVLNVTLNGGIFLLNTADDAIHSNDTVIINAGTYTISTGDDGLHSDSKLTINGGEISIKKSYEGIESENMTINNGTIHLISSDDGINGAGGNDSSGITNPGIPGQGQPGKTGQDGFATGNAYLYLNGGYIVIDASGDGVDINGSIEMTGGTLIVSGPIDNGNGALDYDKTFKITGGFVIAAGSSGMAMAPSTTSTVYSILIKLPSTQKAETIFNIQDSTGKEIVTYAPAKQYQSVTVSSPLLKNGETYSIYYGGLSTGINSDGLYNNGIYTAGTLYKSYTISGIVTK